VAWQLDPNALQTLRDLLLDRGVPSLLPGRRKPAAGSQETETLLRRIAPFLELLYLMMVADGTCDERERRLLRGVARTFGGGEVSSATVDQLLVEFDANKVAEGVEGRLETIANGLSADRLDAEAAFTLTAAMAVADNTLPETEQALLGQLAKVLGISANRARELVEHNPLSVRTHPVP
jgi:uncharacterized tellurite resistance protein B-like protein